MPVFADLLPEPGFSPTTIYTPGLSSGISSATMIFYCLLVIFCIIALWIIFKKAGRKGRESIIPFWNSFVTFKIAGKKNWFRFLIIPAVLEGIVLRLGNSLGINDTVIQILIGICGILSLVGMILYIIMFFKLAKKFGKSARFGLGLVLLSPIFLGILAFGKAKYNG